MSTITTPTTLSGTYTIDPTHSRIGFVARHAMVTKVRGSFNEFEGSGYFDAENPSNSKLQLTIKAASIDTRNADRDGHLRSNDFFDMENHPEITFVSTGVEQADAESYRVTGDLTIKGITQAISFPAKVGVKDGVAAASGTATVDRTKFDIKFRSKSLLDTAADKVIDDNFTLNFNVVAKKDARS